MKVYIRTINFMVRRSGMGDDLSPDRYWIHSIGRQPLLYQPQWRTATAVATFPLYARVHAERRFMLLTTSTTPHTLTHTLIAQQYVTCASNVVARSGLL